jgi:chromosomal replication initiator protein
MVTEIEPPCYETRMAIVKRKSRDRGHEVPDDVSQLIAEQVDQNVRELEGAVTRLIGYSSLTGRQISIELAREALADVFQVRRGVPTMDDIISVVTEHFSVKLTELQSKKRTKSIAFPRQIAMYLARKITRHSLGEIGGFFGGRDHSTVLYAVDRIATAIAGDEETRAQVGGMLDRLQAGRTV